jgi:cytochrome P450
MKKLPGPRGLPFLGNSLEFRKDLLGFLSRCAREYGDISGFRLFHIPCCLLNHPDWIEQALVHHAARTHKSWDFKYLKKLLGNGLLTSEGSTWKWERHLIQPAFQAQRVKDYAAIMLEKTEKTISQWKENYAYNLQSELSRLTLEIVTTSLFGLDFSPHVQLVSETLEIFMAAFEKMFTGWLPLPFSFPTPAHLRLNKKIRDLDQIFQLKIRDCRNQKGNGNDVIDRLTQARDPEGNLLSDIQIRDELMTLIMAGHETTALALSWTLMLIAQHPAVEEDLLREIKSVLGDRSPGISDLPNLPLVQRVLDEGMRLYPPAWGLGREALEDLEIGGYLLPKGTQILLLQFLIQRDPRFFPEPLKFDPTRWIPDKRRSIPQFAYFPFGGGPRTCIGKHFALQEASLILTKIIQCFHLQWIPNQVIELQPSVTLRPRNGIWVKFFRRGTRTC